MDGFADNAIRQAPLWLTWAAVLIFGAQVALAVISALTSLRSGLPVGLIQIVALLPDILFRPAILLGLAALISALRRR